MVVVLVGGVVGGLVGLSLFPRNTKVCKIWRL